MVSISTERAALADIGGGLIRREQWGARYDYETPVPDYDPWPGRYKQVVEPARQVFIHVSVTNPAAYSSHAEHVQAIENIGINRFPKTGMSYNRIILFGVNTAYEGQPMGRRGAHTVNDFGYTTCQRWGDQCPGQGGSFDTGGHGTNLNYSARAYCYGALCEATATDSVVDTFARTIANDMKAGLVRRDAEIHGHRCVSAKECPCGMWPELHNLHERIDHYLEDDDMTPEQAKQLETIYSRVSTMLSVLNSYDDAKIQRPDADGTSGMRWALQRVWEDTHRLFSPVVTWEDGQKRTIVHTLSWLQRANQAVLSAQDGLDTAAILAKLDEVAAADAARDQALLDAITVLESGDGDAALAKLHALLDAALTDDDA